MLDFLLNFNDTNVVPSRNIIKIYIEDGYYHIYNRGVEKRTIFSDEQDYGVCLSYLRNYLLPKDEGHLRERLSDPDLSYKERDKILRLLKLNNFYDEISLLAYCLMPNHFHLLIKQKSKNSIDKFMKSFCTRYSMYFNRKYRRVGPLFQDVYKAAMVETEEQLLYLTGYIHRNPLELKLHKSASKGSSLGAYLSKPSSLSEYLGFRQTEWVHPEEILTHFSKTNPKLSYQAFVEQSDDPTPIGKLAVDLDL